MFSRRSLFRKLGAIIAVVAIAPEIAFAARLPIPNIATLFNESIKLSPWIQSAELVVVNWTAIVENPNATLVIENFSDECEA